MLNDESVDELKSILIKEEVVDTKYFIEAFRKTEEDFFGDNI